MSKPKNIIIIPRCQVILRFIELPSLDFSEIKSMVEFQALKELPCSKEEVITSFRNTGSYKKGFSYIMLAIVKKQPIEKMMAEKEIKPEYIRLETELLYLYLLKKEIAKQNKVSLVINIQKDYSEIIIIDKTRPVFSRGVSNGGEWLEEINRSVISYKRNRDNREIEEIVIMYGSNLSIENIKPYIKEYFTNPVSFYEYKDDLAGLDIPLEIDLLPGEYIDKRLSKENTKQALITCFLLFIALAMLASLLIFKTYEKSKIMFMISEKIEEMQEDADQLDMFIKKTDVLKNQKEEGERFVNILKECYELAPQDISLRGLDCGSRDIFYCKGITRDMTSVFNFIKALEKSKYFKKVEIKYATKKQIGNQKSTDFNIACFTH